MRQARQQVVPSRRDTEIRREVAQDAHRALPGHGADALDGWVGEEIRRLAGPLRMEELPRPTYTRLRRIQAGRSAPRLSDLARLVDAGVPAAAIVALLTTVATELEARGARQQLAVEALSLAVVTRESAEGVAASAQLLEQPDCAETLTRAVREAFEAREAWDRRYRWLVTQRRLRRAALTAPPSVRAGRAARRLSA